MKFKVETIKKYPKYSAIIGIIGGIFLGYCGFTSGSYPASFILGMFAGLLLSLGIVGIQHWNYVEEPESN